MDHSFILSRGLSFKHTIGGSGVFGKLFHEYYEVFLFIDGDVEFQSETIKKTLSPYEMLVIPPGTYHCFSINGSAEKYERCVFEFEKNILDSIDFSSFSNRILDVNIKDNKIIRSIFERNTLYKEDPKYENVYDKLILSTVKELIINIKIDYENIEFKKEKKIFSPLTNKIIEYIDANIHRQITIQEIADELFVSRSTLMHVFQIDTKTSILKYAKQKKIIYSRQLLLNGKKPTDVCNELGFNSYSSFYRLYKRYYINSPKTNKQLGNKKTN